MTATLSLTNESQWERLLEPLPNTRLENLTGQTFGILTVLGYGGRLGKRNRHGWVCRCECGNVSVKHGYALKNGTITGCSRQFCEARPPKTYDAAHDRVKERFGSASLRTCIVADCSVSADDWAYQHDDPNELVEWKRDNRNGEFRYMKFSQNLGHYAPMCKMHHAELDRNIG